LVSPSFLLCQLHGSILKPLHNEKQQGLLIPIIPENTFSIRIFTQKTVGEHFIQPALPLPTHIGPFLCSARVVSRRDLGRLECDLPELLRLGSTK
jgi:hypothetical protein